MSSFIFILLGLIYANVEIVLNDIPDIIWSQTHRNLLKAARKARFFPTTIEMSSCFIEYYESSSLSCSVFVLEIYAQEVSKERFLDLFKKKFFIPSKHSSNCRMLSSGESQLHKTNIDVTINDYITNNLIKGDVVLARYCDEKLYFYKKIQNVWKLSEEIHINKKIKCHISENVLFQIKKS